MKDSLAVRLVALIGVLTLFVSACGQDESSSVTILNPNSSDITVVVNNGSPLDVSGANGISAPWNDRAAYVPGAFARSNSLLVQDKASGERLIIDFEIPQSVETSDMVFSLSYRASDPGASRWEFTSDGDIFLDGGVRVG